MAKPKTENSVTNVLPAIDSLLFREQGSCLKHDPTVPDVKSRCTFIIDQKKSSGSDVRITPNAVHMFQF
jgi:hypothetical protein